MRGLTTTGGRAPEGKRHQEHERVGTCAMRFAAAARVAQGGVCRPRHAHRLAQSRACDDRKELGAPTRTRRFSYGHGQARSFEGPKICNNETRVSKIHSTLHTRRPPVAPMLSALCGYMC